MIFLLISLLLKTPSYYSRAIESLQSGNIKGADSLFKSYIKLSPKDTLYNNALFYLCIFAELKDSSETANFLTVFRLYMARKCDSVDEIPYRHKFYFAGLCYENSKQYKLSVENLSKEKGSLVYFSKVEAAKIAFKKLKDKKLARALLLSVVKQNPESGYAEMARFYLKKYKLLK